MENLVLTLEVNSNVLKKCVSICGSAVPERSIVPIQEYLLFSIEGDKLHITGSDTKMSISTSMGYVSVDFEEDVTKFLVEYDTFYKLLKTLPNGPIKLLYYVDETGNSGPVRLFNYNVKVMSEKDEYDLKSEDPTYYNRLSFQDTEVQEIKAGQIKEGIKLCKAHIGTDEARPQFTGIYFDTTGGLICFASTNGFQIACFETTTEPTKKSKSFTMPKVMFNFLESQILDGSEEIIKLYISDKTAKVEYLNFVLICPLIEEKFPNYRPVLEHETKYLVNLNSSDWLTAIRRALIFADDKTFKVTHSFLEETLYVKSTDDDKAKGSEQIVSLQNTIPEQFTISFNGKFLIDILQVIEGDVRFHLNHPNRQAFLYSDNHKGNRLLYLISPIINL